MLRLMLKLAGEQGRLTVVTDEAVEPTYTPDFARQLVALTATNGYGIVHATGWARCPGTPWPRRHCAWPASPGPGPRGDDGDDRAQGRRPAYSILAHRGLRDLDSMVMRPWQEALAEYVVSLTEVEPGEPTDPNQPTGLGHPEAQNESA